MAYTPIFITQLEAQLLNKEGVTAADLGRTVDQFQSLFEYVHAGIESAICMELNRKDLTAAILAGTGYAHIKATSKLVAAMMIGNWYVWLKHLKMNKVVVADGMQAMIAEVPILTKEMKGWLRPHRRLVCGAVSPDASYEHVLDESDDADVANAEGATESPRLISDTRDEGEDT